MIIRVQNQKLIANASILLCFISDKTLLSFNLKRSNTLPVLMDYVLMGKGHPIMTCLADQTRYDLEWKNHCFNAETLLETILFNLETGNVVWPIVSFINKEEWIKIMRKNHSWHLLTNEGLCDPQFTTGVEDLLFNLASNYLKRQIQLIPMFKKGIKVFGKNFSNLNPYRLFFCQQVGPESFFISVFCK